MTDRIQELETEVRRLREAIHRGSRALDEVVRYFDSTGLPPAGFPLASVVRPAADALRAVREDTHA